MLIVKYSEQMRT